MKAFITALFISVMTMLPASAQQQFSIEIFCGPADVSEQVLRQDYGEQVLTEGIIEDEIIMQLWANLNTGTWTLTTKNGDMSCLVAEGNNFQVQKPQERPEIVEEGEAL
jgi:hypothetical protein